ncbi:MAG: hypothetical protein K6F14_00780 [Clostridiales bacterium]|nr:hypothetical protein [Clostridiales bacterium]
MNSKYSWNEKLDLVDEKYVEESNPLEDKKINKKNTTNDKKRIILTVTAAAASLAIALIIIIVNVENGKKSNPIIGESTDYEFTQTNSVGTDFETTTKNVVETTAHSIVGTGGEATIAVETTDSVETTSFDIFASMDYFSEFTYEEWKNMINYDEYTEYVKSNDNVKITVRIYNLNFEDDTSGIRNTYPVPMIVKVENIGNTDIYQITPNSCDEPAISHHHRLSLSLTDKYGNYLFDATEMSQGHDDSLGIYKLSAGESFEYVYCLASGHIFLNPNNLIGAHEGYKITMDESGIHDFFVKLYDYESLVNSNVIDFSGVVAFQYKFEDGWSSNTKSISVEIDIPVKVSY